MPSQIMASTVIAERNTLVETLQMCPLCSGTSFRTLRIPGHWIGGEFFRRTGGGLGLRRCQSCSLSFVNPRPARELLNAFYDSENYVCHNADSGNTKTAQFLLECVTRYGPYPAKRLLDFGCGGGFLLRAARDDKWEAVGYDVGRRARSSCDAQGLHVTADLGDLASSSFDVVFLNHVFEHISEPQSVLSECRRVLRKDGKLFIVVPNLAGLRARLSAPLLSKHFNVDERHRAFPIHLFYFAPDTLSRTLEKHGFRMAGVETFGLGMDEFINRPGGGGDSKGGTKAPLPKKKSGIRRILKKTFFEAHLGENLLAVARPA